MRLRSLGIICLAAIPVILAVVAAADNVMSPDNRTPMHPVAGWKYEIRYGTEDGYVLSMTGYDPAWLQYGFSPHPPPSDGEAIIDVTNHAELPQILRNFGDYYVDTVSVQVRRLSTAPRRFSATESLTRLIGTTVVPALGAFGIVALGSSFLVKKQPRK